MTRRPLLPRRLRYRAASAGWYSVVSPTLPRRVLYGAFFFYAAYCVHLATFWHADADLDTTPPAATAMASALAPIDSGVCEPALLRLVQGRSSVTDVSSVSSVSSSTAAPGSGT